MPARASVAIAKKNTQSGGRLILLEDNDSVRMATELFLTLEGFDTRSAATVAEAQKLLLDMRPGDVFIADYHLDGKLTGIDVLQQILAPDRARTQGIDEHFAIFGDDGFLAVVTLNGQPRGQDTNDRHQGDTDDGNAKGQFRQSETTRGRALRLANHREGNFHWMRGLSRRARPVRVETMMRLGT